MQQTLVLVPMLAVATMAACGGSSSREDPDWDAARTATAALAAPPAAVRLALTLLPLDQLRGDPAASPAVADPANPGPCSRARRPSGTTTPSSSPATQDSFGDNVELLIGFRPQHDRVREMIDLAVLGMAGASCSSTRGTSTFLFETTTGGADDASNAFVVDFLVASGRRLGRGAACRLLEA